MFELADSCWLKKNKETSLTMIVFTVLQSAGLSNGDRVAASTNAMYSKEGMALG